MNFQNKTVLITGASGGIGRTTAIAFATAGARVALHYGQRQESAQQIRESLPGEGHGLVQADLADAIAVEQMVSEAIAQLGHIDILVNNAGVYQEHPLDQTSYSDWQTVWQQTLNVNLLGAANITYCVARHMIERRSGRIVNVSSRGAFRGEPNATAYGASKAGLNALGQSLAQHLAPYNIGVMTVAPGFVETDMAREVLDSPRGDSVRQQSPLNRVARPEEVAHTILFLAADESLFLTGGIVDVNGASYLR
ncbi:SDR family oxidoreductase [Oscillatoria sp. FACHB-1407]|uniref:SDR family NAD(P)-dependent oxidoreductase n=1 Tax=Oscillatoria sp. FACHB-1407 TaxID=2692847 RepID=UPI0016882C61|nr:SDR family NAD(P)-dependent oxidoreductase [Oscillatoria sp. FACHB-1407]MBD2461948.1 SDR family oxidoreductase [Oscillatoria sp. FACHB-1407]